MDPEPGSWFHITLLSNIFIKLLTAIPWVEIFFFLLLAISFLVSGAEAAFLNLSSAEEDILKLDDSPAARRVIEMTQSHEHKERLLATILIINNFANVTAILLALFILKSRMQLPDDVLAVVSLVIVTFILLLFGEIVPKVYAIQRRVRLSKFVSLPLMWLTKMLSLPVKWMMKATESLRQKAISVVADKAATESSSREEIKTVIDLTIKGEEGEDEQHILKGIVNFSKTAVRTVMRARVDVLALDYESSLEEVVEFISENKYSRLPVYREDLDNITGILHIKSLLPLLKEDGQGGRWQAKLKKAYFVPENKKLDDLLEELKEKRQHLAVVVDEFGGTAGIVTLEDIIEEIFGEFMDEEDSKPDLFFREVEENVFIFEGRIPLHDLRKILKLDDDKFEDIRGGSDSLAGLILELNEKIPDKGDVIKYENFEFHINSVAKNRITRVKVVINDKQI